MSDFGKSFRPIGRKGYRCEYCYGPIPQGERHHHYQGVYDGEWQNWRMHDECWDAYQTDARYDGNYEFTPGDSEVPERVKVLLVKAGGNDAR